MFRNKGTAEILANYYSATSLLSTKKFSTVSGLLDEIREIRRQLQLSSALLPGDDIKIFFEGLKVTARSKGYSLSEWDKPQLYNDKLFLKTYKEDAHYILSYDITTKELSNIYSYQRNINDDECFFDKIFSDLYFVDNDVVPIDEVNKIVIEKAKYRKLKFGPGLSATDCQSLIGTLRIKNAAFSGNEIAKNLTITNSQYDFSSPPAIKVNEKYLGDDLTFPLERRGKVLVGSGIVGNLRFLISEVNSSFTPRVKLAIKNLFSRASQDNKLNFTRELIEKVKEYNIQPENVKATVDGIGISLNRLNALLTDQNYCLR